MNTTHTERHTSSPIDQPVHVELADEAESNEGLDAALDAARSEFERAEADAVEAEQRAAEAAELFATQPSTDTHAASAVAAQLALNARQLTRQRGEQLARLDSEHVRRGQLARLRALQPAADAERFLSSALGEVEALVAQLQIHLASVSRRLVANLDAQNSAAVECARLITALGMPGPAPRRVSLDNLNQRLQTGLVTAFPQARVLNPLGGRASVPERITGHLQRGDGRIVVNVSAMEFLSEGAGQ